MKKHLLMAGAIGLLVSVGQAAWAQGPGGPPLPVAVPIDAGLTMLLAAGAVVGINAYRKQK